LKLIYFVGEGIFTPVLDSQVLVPLNLIGKEYPQTEISLLNLTSFRHIHKESTKKRMQEVVEAVPGVRVFNESRFISGMVLQHYLWGEKLRKCISTLGYTRNDRIVVHSRGHSTAAAAAVLKNRYPGLRILLDIRGDTFDEVGRATLARKYLFNFNRKMFKLAAENADGLTTVSEFLLRRILGTGLIKSEIPKTVVGCCVDTSRFFFDVRVREKYRQELNIWNKFVLCYCGAMSHWQKPDALAEIFAIIAGKIANSHFLIVSKEPHPLIDNLKKLNIDKSKYTTLAAPHSEVANYLMAADVGLLLREDTMTNRVASPVKFAEYLRCGLPVLLTPCIGDFGNIVQKYDVGATVNLPLIKTNVENSINTIYNKLKNQGIDYRKRCSQIAAENLSWEGNLTKLYSLYEKLIQD